MTLMNFSRKTFSGLFFQSLKFTIWFPLFIFITRIIHTFSHSANEYNPNDIGFFWYLNDPTDIIMELGQMIFIPIGMITALMLFNFTWSKKKTNVVFSLGLSRTEIFLAKFLAGIVPFVAVILLSAGLEIFACAAVGFKLTVRYLIAAVFITSSTMAPFILSFCLSAAVISSTNNVIEGGIFAALILSIPKSISTLLLKLFSNYTLGASNPYTLGYTEWNWTSPWFNNSDIIINGGFGEAETYLSKSSTDILTLNDWSGVIMSVIYSAIAITLALIFFNRRKNENAGTFGKSTILSELCAIIAGIIVFNYINSNYFYGTGNVSDFIISLLIFTVVYFVFRVIFVFKSKKEIIKSLFRLPTYLSGFIGVFMIFYNGCFGYSAYIPPVSDIGFVTVQMPFYMNTDDKLSDHSEQGLKRQNIRNDILGENFENYVLYEQLFASPYEYFDDDDGHQLSTPFRYEEKVGTFVYKDDIEKIIEFHKTLIADGHMSPSSEDTQGTCISITYHMNDKTQVQRLYSQIHEDTMLKLLRINDLMSLDCEFINYFGSYEYMHDYYSLYDSTKYYTIDKKDDKSPFIYVMDCYLMPTDMSAKYNAGCADADLIDALVKDMQNQSADSHYLHSAEDELGIITLDLDFNNSDNSEYSDFVPEDDTELPSWNLNGCSTKSFVITKDMVNTVRYLESKDLMKHFGSSRTAEDISHVKLATMGELYGENKKHLNIPLFYGAKVTDFDLIEAKNRNGYFSDIREKIEDKTEIRNLMDKAVVFGYCSNSSKIMEITYNDGVVVTMMIPVS